MAFRSQSRRVHQQLLPCLFWVILATAMIAPFEASAKAIALVVGIKEYSGHGLPELITPENDATGFAQKLIDIHSYSAQDVHVLLGSKQQADRKSILAKWAELVGKLQEHDAIVFFFAGHAIELRTHPTLSES